MTERKDLPSLATRAEAAAALRVSVRTVDRLIVSGRLSTVNPTERSVRITVDSIDALLTPGAPDASPSAATQHGAPGLYSKPAA